MKFKLTNYKQNKVMKTIEINIYSFNELSSEAKQTAIEKHLNNNFEFHWGDEAIQSIKKGLEHFNCSLGNRYSIDFSSASQSYTPINLNMDYSQEISELNGVRLYKFLVNNFSTYFCRYDKKTKNAFTNDCIFTGYCIDNSFMQPVLDFLKRPTKNVNFLDLIESCVYAALKDIQNDYEYQQSEEYLADFFEANEYQFTENGEIY